MRHLKVKDAQHEHEHGMASAASAPRNTREYDPVEGSEVAMLQRYLQAEFAEPRQPRRLPLAISLPLIAVASGALWAAIIGGVRMLAG